ncbi:hypothetical protein D3C74_436860 [compost metagenome]
MLLTKRPTVPTYLLYSDPYIYEKTNQAKIINCCMSKLVELSGVLSMSILFAIIV